jgi:hypothetical protein
MMAHLEEKHGVLWEEQVSLEQFSAVSNGLDQLSPDLSCYKLPLGLAGHARALQPERPEHARAPVRAVLLRVAYSVGAGGPPGPLASRLHSIPTHFTLNLHGI